MCSQLRLLFLSQSYVFKSRDVFQALTSRKWICVFQDTIFFKRSADIYDYQAMMFIYERFVCIVAVMICSSFLYSGYVFFSRHDIFKRGADIYDYQVMIFIYDRFVCIIAVMICSSFLYVFSPLLFRLSFPPVSVQICWCMD